ncbi:MAG: hypothetical protein ACI81O_000352 [Cyclobacteriaceae bacterium]
MRQTIQQTIQQTRRHTSLGLLLCLATGCANQPANTASATPPIIDEQLLAAPPTGWQIVDQLNNTRTRLVDYIPAEQTPDNWQTRLSFESHAALTDLDPIETLLREVEKTREKCSDLKDYNLFSGLENNYRTSTRLMLCGNNAFTQRGEISMLKVIQGNDYFYFVRLVKRLSTFDNGTANIEGIEESEIAVWSTYLSNIRVCDPRLTAHPCYTTHRKATGLN